MKNRSFYITIILLIITISVNSQNMVLNHSFEEIEECIEEFGGFPIIGSTDNFKTNGWYRPHQGHPDLFHICHPSADFVSIPQHFGGYQFAQHGNAYVGICTSADLLPNLTYREYIQSELKKKLLEGKEYFLNFWVASIEQNHTAYIDRIGAHLSLNPLLFPDAEGVMSGIEATIESPSNIILKDTQNWIPINGTFTSEGNEKWLTIGNFISTENLFYEMTPGMENDNFINSYYLIDNICLLDLNDSDAIHSNHYLQKCPAKTTYLGIDSELDFYYLWSNGSNDSSLKIIDTGNYWLKRIDLNNCVLYIDSFIVTNLPYGYLNLGNDTIICKGDSFSLGINIDNAVYYQWNSGHMTPTIIIEEPGTYSVLASDGCTYYMDTIVVTKLPKQAFTLPSDTSICKGETLLLKPNLHHNYISDFQWKNGNNSEELTVTKGGNYVLQTVDYCNNHWEDSIKIIELDCSQCIESPNAFSPNNDGLNDYFKVLILCDLDFYEISIFNGWGELIYNDHSFNHHWDGFYQSKACDIGVYSVIIRYRERSSSEYKYYHSDLHLLK